MIEFEIKEMPGEDEPFIELNKLLKVLRWVESGAMANEMITEQLVKVNGNIDTRKRAKLRRGDIIEFEGNSAKII